MAAADALTRLLVRLLARWLTSWLVTAAPASGAAAKLANEAWRPSG